MKKITSAKNERKIYIMKHRTKRTLAYLLLFIYAFSIFYSPRTEHALYIETLAKCDTGAYIDDYVSTLSDDVKVSSRFYELFFGKKKDDTEQLMLYPGGSVFGLLINEDGVTVTSNSASKTLLLGDRITKVCGKEVRTPEEVDAIVRDSGGTRVEIELIRSGAKMTVSMTPKAENGEYKLGVKMRSSTAGIGTVTFIDPLTMTFGGLGHGVSDGECGGYVSIKSATVNDVVLGGCKRGEMGKAGELTGVLKKTSHGCIYLNNECGVFGVLDKLPDYATELMPAAKREEVKEGAAEIISTVKNGKRQTYKIEIYDIDESSTGSKSFKIKVTDPTLISLTGGIVRGMSGSPIIQNGKIVGAVTHVLVANPTEGYGIFIENMLNAAQTPQARAA